MKCFLRCGASFFLKMPEVNYHRLRADGLNLRLEAALSTRKSFAENSNVLNPSQIHLKSLFGLKAKALDR
jgi:hypothetical protein